MPNLAETIANSPLFKRWQEADLKAKNPEHRGDLVLMTRRPVSQECHALAQSLLKRVILPVIESKDATPTLEEVISTSPLFQQWRQLNKQVKRSRSTPLIITCSAACAEGWDTAQSLLETIVLPAIKVQEAGEKKRP